MENEFKFINQKEIYQYKFYMIPKELFVNERYTSLSPAEILLYGILLDRLTLSIKNNWIDKNGNVYLIFTRLRLMNQKIYDLTIQIINVLIKLNTIHGTMKMEDITVKNF